MRSAMLVLAALVVPVASSCAPEGNAAGSAQSTASDSREPTARDGGETAEALRTTLERAHTLADSIEDLLRPVPLMRPGDEQALRRHGQSAQLARARALGVRPANDAELEAAAGAGRLVALEDSTRYWILRDLRASRALVTPDTKAFLERLGARFQERLGGMGIPPYRLEITSALRSAADQARLRRTNVNAAQGTSTHEYGTTVDIAYSAFAPPQEIPEGVLADGPEWLRPLLEEVTRPILESVSARKSRELTAILGEVLLELQNDGQVMVTLERLQPVYHITIARRMAAADG